MVNIDWSTFTVKQVINCSSEDVRELISTAEGLEKWFLRSADLKTKDGQPKSKSETLKHEDTYRWLWHGYPDSVFEERLILESQNDELIRFVFGEAGTVAIKIANENGTQIIELTQSEIPTDEKSKENFYAGCKSGWTFYLLNLKSVLEFGNDLRNKNSALNLD